MSSRIGLTGASDHSYDLTHKTQIEWSWPQGRAVKRRGPRMWRSGRANMIRGVHSSVFTGSGVYSG